MTDTDLITEELTIGGMPRRYGIRLPHNGSAGQPLVILLHGNHPEATGAQMREWTTFDRHAEAHGWVVGYPDGHGGSWADGRGVTIADEAGVDDIAFLSAMIDRTADRFGTLADRTVVAGISNGAFMAHHLAVRASDRVAVFTAVAGGLPASLADVEPTHAVSALLMHGTADAISSIDGGYSRHLGPNGELRGRTLSLAETADRWRSIDGCTEADTLTTEFSRRTGSSEGIGGTRVAVWTLIGAGHTWPGTEPGIAEFDAAEEICRFAAPLLVSADARKR